MRAPIGFRISNRRKSLKISQAALARLVGISPSYLNLIENNKRDIGGALLNRVASQLGVDIDELAGTSEQKLLQDLEEAFADPLVESLPFQPDERRELVAQYPASAGALSRLHRAYVAAVGNADAYADRLRSDPLLSQLLHQILSGITAIRSSAEILEDVGDLDEAERQKFLAAIGRDSRTLSDVARNLIGQFDTASQMQRSLSPAREIDDLLIERENHFPMLEAAAEGLRDEIERAGAFGIGTLTELLEQRFGVSVRVGGVPDEADYPGQYRFDPRTRRMWLHGASMLATRQFQLARLYGELAAPEAVAVALESATLSTPTARRLASRAVGSYLAGAMIFPYARFLEDAEACAYDVDHLRQAYNASFEQVAHRLVSLRRPGQEGIAFGFLRSDPAGRLTKHFPLPGLLLPNSGHACPLWAIYGAFRSPDALQRQVVRFSDGSRYLFLARTVQRRTASFREQAVAVSVMLACDVLQADRTVYAEGLDLSDLGADILVGPSCRLCTRYDCTSRQEEALSPTAGQSRTRGPLLPLH
ncbi:MAG: short-chain fatty acyl-CoA regulator family protein [Candidatus Devosia phytovorans]|uniref:Short-chain fatty acyl-CoA regulator family protein n=1 Tax=Candidatus Devosia phytovorans TaxID=3121372 RepID=A0AAJ6B1S8_9HYPH|nr:short-chain fatty acyl-CoA regulator family protein [Devosia sp.]WEK06066.1 MAG: short-chain fatty acyl-CoA regulator family protein [Devosia sp.]